VLSVAPFDDANVMVGVKQAKRLLLIGIYVLLGLAAACVLSACFPSAEGKQPEAEKRTPEPPNVILILTDDLTVDELNQNTLEHMPNIKSQLIDEGTTFDNSFVSNSLCCPSRATILRGQYSHSHQILSNEP
jgi:N-acetylglucosamine-6-sulfatase